LNRCLCFFLLIFLSSNLFAYDVIHYSDTFNDQSRGNRQISVEVFYPSSDSQTSFPVIVFGHGWLMSYSNYQQLAQSLSSYGFITVFPTTEGGLFPSHGNFGLDINFVGHMIQLENIDENSNLYNIVDSTSIAMGHSMGGGCSVLASSGNAFFSGLITFAAAETNPSAIAASRYVTCPSLTFSADNDWIAPPETNQIPIYDSLASQLKYYINIFNESHTGITSNAAVPLIIIPFINYLSSGNQNYLLDFENTLDSLSSNEILEYESQNNTSVDDNIETSNSFDSINYPNPINGLTTIKYLLPDESRITINVFDILGRRVASLKDGIQPAGTYQTIWDAGDRSSGVYFYKITVNDKVETKKMLLIK